MDSPQPDLSGLDLLVCSLRAGEDSRQAAIRLASARRRVALRLGGASGSLQDRAAHAQHTILGTLKGCDITVLGGATRILDRQPPHAIRPSVNELLPLIASVSPQARVIGLVPRQTRLRLLREGPLAGKLLVSDKPQNDHITIVHPDFDFCLLLQYSVDRGLEDWDKEWMVSLDYMAALRTDASYRTCHLFYGGGKTTRREIKHVAALPHNLHNPWHVVLIADSGGVTGQLAADQEFRSRYSHSLVVCNANELRPTLAALQVIEP